MSAAVSSWPVDYIAPGDQVEGYLSRLVQDGLARPDALVVRRAVQDRTSFVLLRKGESDVGLALEADSQAAFHNAKQAVHALLRAERARKK